MVRLAFRICSRTQHVNHIKYSGNCTHHPLFDTQNFCGLPTHSVFVFCVIFAAAVPTITRLVLPQATHTVLCEVCICNVADSRSSIAGLWVQYRVRLYEICGRQSGSGTGSCRSTSVSHVSIIPPMLHNHLHRNTSIIRRTSGRSLGTSISGSILYREAL